MNKRQFDLSVGVTVGVIAAFTGLRLWAAKTLLTDTKGGALFTFAEVVKSITG